jgi:hypothetical protein
VDTKDDLSGKKVDRSKTAGGVPTDPRNEALPGDFEDKAKQRFEKLEESEVTFSQYLEFETSEFHRQRALEKDPSLRYQPNPGTMTPCGNGDFDDKLDPDEWQGAYGLLPDYYYYNHIGNPPPALGSPINFAAFTTGLLFGTGIADINSHQTWVTAGTDPIVPISRTAQNSAGAIRIGNAVQHYGCELLSKTFVVTAANSLISFWYAVVLQDPGHPTNQNPFFWVRVLDAAGNIVPGAFDFGHGSDKLIADSTHPFFYTQTGTPPGYAPSSTTTIVYKDWSCAQIDLSTQVGKQVTIEFVTADCGQGGHWGYAYIDSFCGDCGDSPTGNITYNCEASTHCGSGQICFNYSLPTTQDASGGTITGSVTISLDIYQSSALVHSFTSLPQTSGSTFCFAITPTSIPGINPALGGFDFVATGVFAIGSTPLGHIAIGTRPDGMKSGMNNDYQIACKTCAEITQDQNAYLSEKCEHKVHFLARADCDCPDNSNPQVQGDCQCDCVAIDLPNIQPCISVGWGDSHCDCLETDDVEILCITVCNCYSNVTFTDLSIGHVQITDKYGNPVPTLPDGTPSVQVIPSGPICFGDIGPCSGGNQPGCVSRELVIYTRGAIGDDYILSFEGVCFTVSHHFQSKQCFIVPLCQD